MPKRLAAAQVRATFKDVLSDIRRNGERVKVTRHGRTVAWMVPVQDGDALETCRDEIASCVERTKRADG